jgi:glycerophosphoryl diester phosphodiesterase
MTRAFLSIALFPLAASLAACGAAAKSGVPALVPGEPGLPALFDCLREEQALAISAHRGGPVSGFPENAIETFANTVSRIPAILEVDIQPSSDGVLVLMHDDTLDRTTTGEGPVGALTLEQLRALRLVDNDGAETDFRIPTLDEALDWAEGEAILVMDRKQGMKFAEIVDRVRAADAMDRVIWATYSDEEVADLAGLAPEAVIVAAMDSEDDLDRLVESGASADRLIVWSGTETPQPDLYAAMAAQGVESAFATLGAWTGSWDNRIAALGDDALYARVTAGAHLLATDRMFEAYAALPAAQRVTACTITD